MISIGIIGQGFVGSAIRECMRKTCTVYAYDIKNPLEVAVFQKDNEDRIGGLPHFHPLTEMIHRSRGPIFVCVPTPMKANGECDTSIVESVVREINYASPFFPELDDRGNLQLPVVVIKSTVSPGTTQRLQEQCHKIHVLFNPEFLTERNAVADFMSQRQIIIGRAKPPLDAAQILEGVYRQLIPDVKVVHVPSGEAEMVKYVANCLLSVKVSFCNEIKLICDKIGINYDSVVECCKADERLGNSHWKVPGPDGKFGFGGKCFGKDLNALMAKSKACGVEPMVMEAAWNRNLVLRPERDWETISGVLSKEG